MKRVNERDSIQILQMLAQVLEAGAPVELIKKEIPILFEALPKRAHQKAPASDDFAHALFATLVLGPVEQAMLQMGLETGQLPAACRDVSASIERRRETRHQLLKRLLYPSFLFISASMILQIPLLFTRSVGAYLSNALPVPVFVLSGFAFTMWVMPRLPRDALLLQKGRQLFSRLPFFRSVALAGFRYRFFFALRKSLESGLTYPRSVELAMRAGGAQDVCIAPAAIQKRADEGAALNDILTKAAVFPKPALAAIAIGEETGTLEKSLERLEREADQLQRRLITRFIWGVSAVAFLALLLFMGVQLVRALQQYFEQIDQIVGAIHTLKPTKS